MKPNHIPVFVIASLAWLATPLVLAQLPKRDLIVELRHVEDVHHAGYSVSTQSGKPLLLPQSVQVRNGDKASLSIGNTMTLQWVQSAQAQSASLSSASAAASSQSGAVSHALATLKSGQTIMVHPSWPGARQPVTVEIEVQSDVVEPRNGGELPSQSHNQMATTVSAPLGQWITIARTGTTQIHQPGVYSTTGGGSASHLLQMRVQAP